MLSSMKKIHLSMINLWCNKNLVDSQLFLWKLLSENPDNIEYYSDPYEKNVEMVILNTCSFISSGREEMFETIEKLLSKNKKVCIIGCGVQYFEKLLKMRPPFGKGGAEHSEAEGLNKCLPLLRGNVACDKGVKSLSASPYLPLKREHKRGCKAIYLWILRLKLQNDNLCKNFKGGILYLKMKIFPIYREMTLI